MDMAALKRERRCLQRATGAEPATETSRIVFARRCQAEIAPGRIAAGGRGCRDFQRRVFVACEYDLTRMNVHEHWPIVPPRVRSKVCVVNDDFGSAEIGFHDAQLGLEIL